MKTPSIVFCMNSMFAVRHFLGEILTAVRQRGFCVVVVAPEPAGGAAAPPVSEPGVEFRFVPMKRDIALLSDLRALWRLWLLLRSARPAITNMSTPKMGLVGGLAAWLARVPHRIYTLRGLRYQTTRSWKRALLMACERVACACAHRVICISHSVREDVLRDRIASPAKATLLGDRVSEGIALPSGAAEEGCPAETLRRQMGIPEDVSVVGFVGRLTRDKGVNELVECFQILLRQGHRARLLLVGDFEPGDPVDTGTADWIRGSPDVHWLGYVPDPAPYYRLMDVFVFPTHREGLGRVLLEAAAAGKPAVSTRTTGVIDVVVDGVTGLLVPPGDAQALARATAVLLGDRETADRMGRAARALVREHFDNSVYLDRLGRLLESMARGEPVPALFP